MLNVAFCGLWVIGRLGVSKDTVLFDWIVPLPGSHCTGTRAHTENKPSRSPLITVYHKSNWHAGVLPSIMMTINIHCLLPISRTKNFKESSKKRAQNISEFTRHSCFVTSNNHTYQQQATTLLGRTSDCVRTTSDVKAAYNISTRVESIKVSSSS